jgi:hypothetical protein
MDIGSRADRVATVGAISAVAETNRTKRKAPQLLPGSLLVVKVVAEAAEEVAHFSYEAHLGERLRIARPCEHVADVADLTFWFLPGSKEILTIRLAARIL